MPDASSFAMRPAIPDDLDALAAIDARCFSGGIAYSKEEIAALLRARNSLTLVAERSQALAGFASLRLLRPRRSSRGALYGELITIDILPELRREGIGRQLYQALEDWLLAQGGTRVELHVAVDNTPAMRFYEYLGYRILHRVPRYYMRAIDAWKMEKALPGQLAARSDRTQRI